MTAPFGFPKLYRFVDIVGIFFRFLHIFKEGGRSRGTEILKIWVNSEKTERRGEVKFVLSE